MPQGERSGDGRETPDTAQQALALFKAAIEAIGDAVMITSPELDPPGPVIEYVNAAFTLMTGYQPSEVIGRTPRMLQGDATDRAELSRMRVDLASRGSFLGEVVNYRKTGEPYAMEWLIAPMHDPAGKVVKWVSIQRDVSERRRREARYSFLVSELQHRVANVIATVRGLTTATGVMSGPAEESAAHFAGRLDALGRAQRIKSPAPDRGTALADIVRAELLAFLVEPRWQVSVSGPDALFRQHAAETWTLAIHELTTNSIKYGALGHRRGSLAVLWRIEKGVGFVPRFCFEWHETGVPTVSAEPRRRGYGTEFLEGILANELGAETSMTFGSDGLRCLVSFPVTDRIMVIPQAGA